MKTGGDHSRLNDLLESGTIYFGPIMIKTKKAAHKENRKEYSLKNGHYRIRTCFVICLFICSRRVFRCEPKVLTPTKQKIPIREVSRTYSNMDCPFSFFKNFIFFMMPPKLQRFWAPCLGAFALLSEKHGNFMNEMDFFTP